MADVLITAKAFSKMLLHAAKYPHCSVNGVFLADKDSDRDKRGLTLVDAIPLFHLTLTLAPMLEIALQQIDAYCKQKGLVLAGYYQANDIIADFKPNLLAQKIVDRIQEHFSQAVLCMVDNRKLSIECDEVCYTMYSQDKDGKWRKNNSCNTSEDSEITTSHLLLSKVHQQLVDFDNHLDDISKSWLNPHINEQVQNAT